MSKRDLRGRGHLAEDKVGSDDSGSETAGAPPKRRFALRNRGNGEVSSSPMTTSRRGGGRAGDERGEKNQTKTTSGRDVARGENLILTKSRRHDLSRREHSGSMVDQDENLRMDECSILSDDGAMMFGR